MQEANERLLWIIPLSLGMIMVLLYLMFGSMKDCMLVLVNVLEAAVGGIWVLYFTGTHFSVSAAVGFVSVFGVAVQDGVLLVTYHKSNACAWIFGPGRLACAARSCASGRSS